MNNLMCLKRHRLLYGLILLAGLTLVSCSEPPEISLPPTPTAGVAASATPAATPTPAPPSTLIVCLAEEPASLYLYGDTNRETDVIFEALYQGPIELVDFRWQSDFLAKPPDLADGDAQIETVSAAFGDVYLNPETLEPERLGSGDPYLPAGCRSMECSEVFQGGQVEMDRLRVQFQLREGLAWSDGEPVTAADSIFSFETAGHPDTPTSKYLFSRTFAYEALDERTLEWVGIPGFVDAEYAANVWTPLPEHLLAEVDPVDLLGLPEASQSPLGYGPYQIDEWQQGRQLTMSRNPEFESSGADSPAFERLVFRFISEDVSSALDQLATGECDVLDEGLLPLAALDQIQAAVESTGQVLQAGPGAVVERLEFSLRPGLGSEYLHLLDEPDMRRALASCIDRDGLVKDLFGDAAAVPSSFLPPGHTQSIAGGDSITYDPQVGRNILDGLGWLIPEDGNGVRTALGVDGLANDTELTFTVHSLPGELQSRILQAIEEDLAECGVGLEVDSRPAAELYEPWPEGPLFGRRFQTALWAWPTFASPACEMFAGWELPTDENPLGINASGYQSAAYDQSCRTVLLSAPGTRAYDEAVRQLQQQFSTDLPALPLLVRPRLLAYADWLCGPQHA
ncbi:MAG: ABC transporter substrate-binding protein, partial [Anaerolineales bacterium]